MTAQENPQHYACGDLHIPYTHVHAVARVFQKNVINRHLLPKTVLTLLRDRLISLSDGSENTVALRRPAAWAVGKVLMLMHVVILVKTL